MLSVSCRSICFSTFFFFFFNPKSIFHFLRNKILIQGTGSLGAKKLISFSLEPYITSPPSCTVRLWQNDMCHLSKGPGWALGNAADKAWESSFRSLSYPLWAPCQESLWCFCLHSITVSPSTFTELTLPTSAGSSGCPFPPEPLWDPSERLFPPGTPPRVTKSPHPTECVCLALPTSYSSKNSSSKSPSVRQGQRQKEQG